MRYFVRRSRPGQADLLIRMGTTLPEYLGDDGQWHPDATLVRHFVDDGVEEVDETEARSVAAALGGSL